MRPLKEVAIAIGVAFTLQLVGMPSAMAVLYAETAPAAAAQADALIGDVDEAEEESKEGVQEHAVEVAPENAKPEEKTPGQKGDAVPGELAPFDAPESTVPDQNLPDPPITQEIVPQPAVPTGGATVRETMQNNGNKKPRLALTLAGGGARGAAHIGVLKVLEREGIKPDFIAGSSIGALIGTLYAAGVPVSEIERSFLDGELRKAFFPRDRRLQSMLYYPRYALQRLLFMKPAIGLYSGKSIEKYMARHLPVANLEELKIPTAVTAIDLVDTKALWMSKGSIARAVRASCSIPLFYRPVKGAGQRLVDGGIRSNLPTDLAEAAGAPIVVAVKLHSYLEKQPPSEFDTTFDFTDRITSIIMAEIEGKAVADADVLVEPKVQFMNIHSFNDVEMSKAILAGEEAAIEALPRIRKALRTDQTASK